MKKKLTISVGIPAYNEEHNIKRLLQALLRQKQTNFTLKEIIVVSDGSDDRTVAEARSVGSKRIRVIAGSKRLGQQVRQNQLLAAYRGDVLVLVEADTLPARERTLSDLIAPFTCEARSELGMTISDRLAVSPQTFLEKILWHGGELKNEIFRDWRRGENVYACGGHALRALPRTVTDSLQWPANVPEDAYLYFWLRQNGFRIQLQLRAQAFMKHVATASDRMRQCSKYLTGKRDIGHYFSRDFLAQERRLPFVLLLRHVFAFLLSQPFWTTLALVEMVINRFLLLRRRTFNSLYVPYQTSKDFSRLELSSYAE